MKTLSLNQMTTVQGGGFEWKTAVDGFCVVGGLIGGLATGLACAGWGVYRALS